MSTVDRTSFEKLNKTQLIDYIMDFIPKFNEQVNNYSVLYTEYQKLLELNTNPQNEDNEEIKTLNENIDTLNVEISALKKLNQSLSEEINLKEKDSGEKMDTNSLIKELEELKNELMILKSQKTNKKLQDINALEKCTKVNYIVQTYNVYGFENRVDNSEVYGGRQFIIATILIKLEDLKFTWNVDFKGSDLFKSSKSVRTLTIKEEDFEKIKNSSLTKGMHIAIKEVFSIKDTFSAEAFFKSPIMTAGEIIAEDFKSIE